MAEEESLISQDVPRTGVILCECGGLIGTHLDLDELLKNTAGLPGIIYTHHEAYPCSKDGMERLRQVIQEKGLERILIAGCAPRLMEKLFRQSLQDTTMDPGCLMVSNIREQATSIHPDDPQAAFQKAMSIIQTDVMHLLNSQAASPHFGKVQRRALVVGSGLSSLSVALALAEQDIPVTIIEQEEKAGEVAPEQQDYTRKLTRDRLQSVQSHPGIKILLNTRLSSISGHPGEYEVQVEQRGQTISLPSGVIIIANNSRSKTLGSGQWFDRSRVKTQAEFENELAQAARADSKPALKDVVMILCAEESQHSHCSRVCCNVAFQQAIRIKQLIPETKVTILFRDLYLSGIGESRETELIQARNAGVTFFRYRRQAPPVIGNTTIEIQDILTHEPVSIPYDRVILTMPLIPAENTRTLSALLGLPLDEYGFLAEPRIRLRPGRYADPGIYVLGSAQQPADTAEALFQAYLTGARALRFLNQETIKVESPVAIINPELCTGCGNCPQVCPANAVHLERRDGILSLSTIDELRCIGCGNCAVVCPVKAISLSGWDNLEIPVQIKAALDERWFTPGQPRILVLACEWSAYGAAELAGHRNISYPGCARIMRMNCSARFDPFHILWAFLNGADGVLLGACKPGECHYGMGNLFARERVEILKEELAQHNVDPRRLRLEYFNVHDGEKFAGIIREFEKQITGEMVDRGQMPSGVHIPVKLH